MTNIVFYENLQEELWFKEQYAELTLEKIIFSNDRKKIDNFNGKSIDELKSSIRSFLPSIGNISDSNTMIYVPVEMKDKFIEILKYLGFKTKKGDTTTIPTSKELGLVKGDIRSSFYDSMTIKDVHVLTEANDMDEIKDLFDEITSADTNIDAVFLARTDNARNPILINSTRINTKLTINAYKIQIQKFLEYVKVTAKATPGFIKAVFEFTPVTVTIVLVGKNQKLLLFFVNETGEELANFDFNIDEYLPKIKELLFNAKKIDEEPT
jgi:hypothetical protein